MLPQNGDITSTAQVRSIVGPAQSTAMTLGISRLGMMGLGVGGALVGLGVSSVFAQPQWKNRTDLSSFRVVRFGRAALAVSGAC